MNREIPQVGEVWRHYKTLGEYEIVHHAKLQVKVDSLDMQECIVYKSLSDGLLWVRPVVDFVESLEIENEKSEKVVTQRFVKVS